MMCSLQRYELMLRLWGCKNGKWNARGQEGKFLGYSPVDDGWIHDETGHHLK